MGLHNSFECNFINFKPKHYLYTHDTIYGATVMQYFTQPCSAIGKFHNLKLNIPLLNTGEEIFTWLSDISCSHTEKYRFPTDDCLYLKSEVKKNNFSIFFPLCLNSIMVLKCRMKYCFYTKMTKVY